MAAPVYATAADVVAFYEPESPPSGIGARQLRAASAQVDSMLLTAVYPTDADQAPTRPADIDALRTATIEQAIHALEHGDEVEILASRAPMSLGPLSLGGTASGGSAAAAVPVWSPAAVAALRAEGLIVGPVQT